MGGSWGGVWSRARASATKEGDQRVAQRLAKSALVIMISLATLGLATGDAAFGAAVPAALPSSTTTLPGSSTTSTSVPGAGSTTTTRPAPPTTSTTVGPKQVGPISQCSPVKTTAAFPPTVNYSSSLETQISFATSTSSDCMQVPGLHAGDILDVNLGGHIASSGVAGAPDPTSFTNLNCPTSNFVNIGLPAGSQLHGNVYNLSRVSWICTVVANGAAAITIQAGPEGASVSHNNTGFLSVLDVSHLTGCSTYTPNANQSIYWDEVLAPGNEQCYLLNANPGDHVAYSSNWASVGTANFPVRVVQVPSGQPALDCNGQPISNGQPINWQSQLMNGSVACASGPVAILVQPPDWGYVNASGGFTAVDTDHPGLAFSSAQDRLFAASGLKRPTTCQAGDPVNCASGVYNETLTDISVPGRGVALNFQRTYSSALVGSNGPFGAGWSDSYNSYLTVTPPGNASSSNVTVTEGTGATDQFLQPKSNSCSSSPAVPFLLTAQPGILASLTNECDGTFRLLNYRTHDTDVFGPVGSGPATRTALTEQIDPNGNTTTLSYNGSGLLTGATDASGRTLSVSYAARTTLISSISVPSSTGSRTWNYSYRNGQLATATDPMGRSWNYGYTTQNLLACVANPLAKISGVAPTTWCPTAAGAKPRANVMENVYQANPYLKSNPTLNSYQVVKQYDDAGLLTTWHFGGDPSSLTPITNTSTNPHGGVTSYTYDNFELVAVTSPLGLTTRYTYDPSSFGVATKIDGFGNVTRNTYDAQGNLTSTTDPLGGTSSFSYSNGYLLCKASPLGSCASPPTDATAYAYEGATVNNPSGNGDVATVTDPSGDVTSYTYASNGDVLSSTRGYGSLAATTTTYTYDANGDVASKSTSPDGGIILHVKKYLYDGFGDLVCSVQPDQTSGIRLALCPAVGQPHVTGTTSYAYDADGELTSTTNALGGTTSSTYDAMGNKLSTVDPMGRETTTTYDPDGRPLVTTTGLKVATNHETSQKSKTMVTYFDEAGARACAAVSGSWCSTSRSATSQVTTTYFDSAGDTVGSSINASDGLANISTLTTLNVPVGTSCPANVVVGTASETTRWCQISKTQNSKATTPSLVTTTSLYDGDGRVIETLYSDATPTVRYSYNADGTRASMIDGSGTTTYGYTANQALKSSDSSLSGTVTYAYDWLGDVTSITYPDGRVVGQSFNGEMQLDSVTDGNTSANTTTFSYDRNGNLAGETFPNGDSTTLSHDLTNEETKLAVSGVAGVAGNVSYTRNANGQVTSEVDSGSVPGGGTYSYNSAGQLISAGTGPNNSFSYNSSGVITSNGGNAQVPNPLGQIQSATAASTTVSYTYDQAGDRTSAVTTAATTNYSFNAAHELTGVTQGSAPSPADTYVYNGDGLRMGKAVSGNTTLFSWNTVGGQPVVLSAGSTDYIYGPLGTPVEQVNGGTGGVAQYLVSDDIGSTRLVLNHDGSVAQALSYSPYGQVTAPSSAVNSPSTLKSSILFAGGYQDNETGFLYLVNRYYDPATGVFVSVDPLVAVTGQMYEYADNKPVDAVDPNGLSWYDPSWVHSATNWTSHHFGTIASIVAGGACLAVTAGTCAVLILSATALEVAQQYRNGTASTSSVLGAVAIGAASAATAGIGGAFEGLGSNGTAALFGDGQMAQTTFYTSIRYGIRFVSGSPYEVIAEGELSADGVLVSC